MYKNITKKDYLWASVLTWNVWGVDCVVANLKVPNYLLWASYFL